MKKALLSSFSCSVMSDTSKPHGLQHARLSCPSLSPGLCTNSYPLSRWCHPTVSSSIVNFSSCLQSFLVFSNELALFISWQKYWSFSFSMSPFNEESIMILNVYIAQNRAKMDKTERKNIQTHNYSWRLWCSSE